MARIEINQLKRVEKEIEQQEIARATFSISRANDKENVFQIDTYSIPVNGNEPFTQSIQFNTEDLGQFLNIISSQYESFSIPLLDDNGDVKYGLNWGNRAGRNINQAYLDLPKSIYESDFFPQNGITFNIRTDDNRNIKFTRAQKDNVNGHALQTPEDNSIIGIYLRNRLSINPGEIITKEAIEEYGRNYITISKIGNFYYLDFSTSKPKQLNNAKVGSLQQIFYGAPGTGKSNAIKREVEDNGHIHFRTTFHPDSDYSTFVGCYKPTMKSVKKTVVIGQDEKEVKPFGGNSDTVEQISYQFVPQDFTKAYCEAWNQFNNEEGIKPVYLIIEEINRGNCAQIFGDIFQLLDRETEGARCGFSTYPIDADEDLKKFLLTGKKEDGTEWLANKDGIKDGKLCLPPNLYIWATMNTSDQSLFPIDSAFKRRWDWKYIPINTEKELWSISVNGKLYSWSSFLNNINIEIDNTTHSEDKKLGFYFCKATDKVISAETFVSKVIFYLYNDVFKDYGFNKDFFKDGDGKLLSFNRFYNSVTGNINESIVELFLTNLKVEKVGTAIDDSLPEVDEDGNNAANQNKDFSKYSINGNGKYSKGGVVFEAMKMYVANNPQMSADDVVKSWLALNVNVPNFVETKATFEERKQKSKDPRINEKAKEFTWAGGTVYISNQYNLERISDFMSKINAAANWGITISKL